MNAPNAQRAPTLACREAVPSSLYSEEVVVRFAGPDYRDFVASGGVRLRPRLARSLALARLGPGVHLLDLGCGRGEVALHAARRGARVTAVDYSADCARMTRDTRRFLSTAVTPLAPGTMAQGTAGRAPTVSAGERRDRGATTGEGVGGAGPVGTLQVAMADATSLPFADASFDRVTALDVVEHLHPWQLDAAMAELRRVLKPNGFAVIHTVPNRWALAVGYRLLRLVRRGLPSDPRTEYEHDVHVNEQDVLSLGRTLRRAGLRGRIWLENLTLEQARWQADSEAFKDVRGASYGFFRHPAVRAAARLALRTPLRLIACNDIYAIVRR